MSGGCFDYKDQYLKSAIFGWDITLNNIPNRFEDREISELIYDVFELIHHFDLYESGDTCKDTYYNEKIAFKKKWFSNRGVRIKRTIDTAIAEVKQELYETYGLELEDKENGNKL